ncbi:hypothetical protein PHLGIDRAFT_243133 [Phlebiopsis gigantea 11061_1 CR5-6]|uniref:SWIM-type domain-containing protein n=1 Tax=Phlebiopsis gigantea (strain 11061_1 CR5-6) TaxID=745531 RepID=A0A0C3S583_PHLG1|nr:hypothetical protein PHLGIDRAFT_243133 [Phlebiopsis gigantea 11061_1 CR5-6]
MLPHELLSLLGVALDQHSDVEHTVEEDGGQLNEEYIDRLKFFFDDNLLLAALDLVDRDNVIKFNTVWGHSKYQVLGSTSTYSVFLGDPENRTPTYCTCPSFAFSVLLTDAQYMCKHLLAVFLSRRLGRCIERPVNPNDLVHVVKGSI